MDWGATASDAFINGLAYVLALGFLSAIIAVTVASIWSLWKTVTA